MDITSSGAPAQYDSPIPPSEASIFMFAIPSSCRYGMRSARSSSPSKRLTVFTSSTYERIVAGTSAPNRSPLNPAIISCNAFTEESSIPNSRRRSGAIFAISSK